MGNGQFGLHIVETPKVDRAIGPPSIPIPTEYERVLFKKEYYPHVTTSTYVSPVKGCLPIDYSNRPFSGLPNDGTLGGGCSSQSPYSSVQLGQQYESRTSTHSNFLSSCTGNYDSPTGGSYPVSRRTTTSGFPEMHRLGQRYNPYYRNVADDFHLRYKENYSNYPTKQPLDHERKDNPHHVPSSYDVNVENMVNNNLDGKMSSLEFFKPSCCDKYTTPAMLKMLQGTEAGRLIGGVCGGIPQGNSPYNGAGRRYGSGNNGEPVSKGAQTVPSFRKSNDGEPKTGPFVPVGRNVRHSAPPGTGFETKESQTTPRTSISGEPKNPKTSGGNGKRTPKKSVNDHNGDNDGDRWIDDPYGHGENENNVPNAEKVPDNDGKNNRPNSKEDNLRSSRDSNGGKVGGSPNGAGGGHGTKDPGGKLYPGGVPNWLTGGDPMGNEDANKKESPTKIPAPPKPVKPQNKINKPPGNGKTVGGNNNKKKTVPNPKKNSSNVENEKQPENKEKQPSTSTDLPKTDPEIPAADATLFPTWSDGSLIQPAPEPSKPKSVPVRSSLPTPNNKPRTSDADKRRKTDPTTRSSIPVSKPSGSRQGVPVVKADRQSYARLKEILSRSFSAGPVPSRRHSDPTPESAVDKKRLNKNKKAKSEAELNLDNLPLTPTVDLSILTGGRKSRRRSSIDDETPPPPPSRPSGPSWFDVMPSSSKDAEAQEKRESSHPKKQQSVHFTGSNKPQPKKSSLKKTPSKHGPLPRVSSSTSSSRSSKVQIGVVKPNNHHPNPTKKKSIRFSGVPPTP